MKTLKNHLTILSVLLLAAAMGIAQPLPAQSNLSVAEILRNTESYYQQLQAFTAYFDQYTTSSAATSMTNEASGRLYYQKPRQMRWEYETPEPQVFVANKELAWLYVPSEKQISLFDADTFFGSPLAQTFFDGVGKLKSHFDVSLDATRSDRLSAVLKLIPRKEDPNIQLLRLWIDLKTFKIERVETQDAMANTNLIVLKSEKPVPHVDDKLFQMEVPSSATVVDAEGRELSPSEIEQLKNKLPSR